MPRSLARTTCSSAAAHRLEPGHAYAGRDQSHVEARRRRRPSRRPPRCRAPGPGRRGARWPRRRRGCCTRTSPVTAADRGHVLLQHQPSAVEHADPGGHLLDLGEQVAGEEDRGAVAVQPERAARGCRGCPAGRGRWSARRARAAAVDARARRRARDAAHAERVGLHRTLVGRVEPDLLEHLGRSGLGDRRDVRADRPGRRRRRGRGWRGRTGAGRRRVPRPGRRPGGAPSPATSASAHRTARPRRRWPAPGRAASARSSSCRSRWRRGSRRRRPRGRRGRRPSTARTAPYVLVRPWVRIIGSAARRAPSTAACPRVAGVTVPVSRVRRAVTSGSTDSGPTSSATRCLVTLACACSRAGRGGPRCTKLRSGNPTSAVGPPP